MDALGMEVFDQEALFVICTSTTGSGDMPDNARHRYEALDTEPRFLGSVRYGVFALGDSTYPQTFCKGGVRFEEHLADLGALRLGEMHRQDASAGTEAKIVDADWIREWLALAAAHLTP